jgi:hypothetical protein
LLRTYAPFRAGVAPIGRILMTVMQERLLVQDAEVRYYAARKSWTPQEEEMTGIDLSLWIIFACAIAFVICGGILTNQPR